MSVTPGQEFLSVWCRGPHSQSGEGYGLPFQNNILNSFNKIHRIIKEANCTEMKLYKYLTIFVVK